MSAGEAAAVELCATTDTGKQCGQQEGQSQHTASGVSPS